MVGYLHHRDEVLVPGDRICRRDSFYVSEGPTQMSKLRRHCIYEDDGSNHVATLGAP